MAWLNRCSLIMLAMHLGYARFSTDNQDLTAHCDGLAALGVKAKRVYVDRGLTGRNRDRQLVEDAMVRGWPREIEHHEATKQRLQQLICQLQAPSQAAADAEQD